MMRLLYETIPGRIVLKALSAPELSRLCGGFLDTGYSRFLIPFFVKKNRIRLNDCVKKEIREYGSFNECFCRKLAEGERPVRGGNGILISPCDGLLSVYPIRKDTVIPVKQSRYRISDLLQDPVLAQKFDGGNCLVFRLCVNHYHRYCYPDGGRQLKSKSIMGVLHTVRPVALRHRPVFLENSREYALLETDHFGTMIQMEVGAMLVGRICNQKEIVRFEKGQEKGCFMYGGSTIILLTEKDRVQIPSVLYDKTEQGKETPVRQGQGIGKKA